MPVWRVLANEQWCGRQLVSYEYWYIPNCQALCGWRKLGKTLRTALAAVQQSFSDGVRHKHHRAGLPLLLVIFGGDDELGTSATLQATTQTARDATGAWEPKSRRVEMRAAR